jgi:hypothetical protein
MNIIKPLMLLCMAGVLAGCNLEVMTPKGGRVVSSSGMHNCAESTNCSIAITDSTFSGSFTAVPNPGYQFVRWQKGNGFFCGDSTDITCTVVLTGNALLNEAIIALFETGYIMPIFKGVGIDTDNDGLRNELDEDDDNDGILDVDDTCPLDPSPDCSLGVPITDTVTIDGREWAQVDLFTLLSWNDVNAVCPEGACSGALNGHNMAGWTWASLADVSAIVNFYAGASIADLESANVCCYADSEWAPAIFTSGMRFRDYGTVRRVNFLTRNVIESDPTFTWMIWWDDKTLSFERDNISRHAWSKDARSDLGHIFYREVQP